MSETEETKIPYDHRAIERRWQKEWNFTGLYEVDLEHASAPFYNLMMFPYPSAEGLHVGNVYAFIGADIYGRFSAMTGMDVFEPIGFDAFGIHSENFAIKKGVHPKALTARNVDNFRTQLQQIGNRFDWRHEVNTTDPAYYKWSQWIFLQLYDAGLAVRKEAPVNWCPSCKTVLADEQVIDGVCERCDTTVVQRNLKQWFFTITAYAQRLLDNLDELDWSERIKTTQRNWIGRSEGLEFTMQVAGPDDAEFRVFTTRPDTLFGVTYVVLAPEHPLVDAITTEEYRVDVDAYREDIRRRTDFERVTQSQAKSGAFTGAYAIHPVTNEQLPIWIAEYVLMSYGTGAIMAVPAHDERDFAFATEFDLPIQQVIVPGDKADQERPSSLQEAYTDTGVLVNSGPFSGATSEEAIPRITAWFEERDLGLNPQRQSRYLEFERFPHSF